MIDTFYVHLTFKTKTSEWSINLPFLCNKCGVCCTLDDFLTAGTIKSEPTNIEAQAKVKALYEELGDLWEVDPEKYDHQITHSPCPFVSGSNCSIYEIRPEGCRQYPNTPFGMQTLDCEPLARFKKQLANLKSGRNATSTYHFTTQSIEPVQFTEKQYRGCLSKLAKAGITKEELSLFEQVNRK